LEIKNNSFFFGWELGEKILVLQLCFGFELKSLKWAKTTTKKISKNIKK